MLQDIKNRDERLWYAEQALEHGWSRPVLVHQIDSRLHPQEYHLEVGGEDFYLDLLFYHLRLRCFVVIELKAGPFKPEHAGKLSFYLSAADDLLRRSEDGPTIGIVLCRSKNKVVVEYALRDSNNPIGVSCCGAERALPERLKEALPALSEIELGPGQLSN